MLKRFLTNVLFRQWLKPLWQDMPSIAEARRLYGAADRLAAIGKRSVAVQVQNLDSVHVEWIGDPGNAKHGVIVFLHGGAFAVRAPLTDRRFCRDISVRTGLPVVLVAYRLAPEHPYPAGLNDCCGVYVSLLAQGIPADRIVLLGHSAGANYALTLLMRARQQGMNQPAGAILMSAPTDMTGSGVSAVENAERDVMLGPAIWPWVKEIYLRNALAADPEISPLFGEWANLPPLHFHVSDSELVLDDSTRAAALARSSGCDADITIWHNVPHNFPFIDYLAEAKKCREEIAAFVARVL